MSKNLKIIYILLIILLTGILKAPVNQYDGIYNLEFLDDFKLGIEDKFKMKEWSWILLE